MKKLTLLSIAIFSTLFTTQAQELKIYNWTDYIDPDLLTEFTQETGIKIIYDTFDSNEVLLAKTLTGNSGYDIIVPTEYNAYYMIQAKRLLPIDHSQIPNYKNIWPFVTERLKDLEPVNDYTVPYMWGTTGIAYNIDKINELVPDAPQDSMELLYNPIYAEKLSRCGIYLLDSPSDVYPMTLLYLGLDPESSEDADLAKATEALEAIRPYVKKFHSSEYVNALANGDACIAMGWSGDVYLAKARANEAGSGIKINYFIPKEASFLWFDQFAILKESKNVTEAYQFINFMLDAKNNARAADYMEYATSNEAAFAYTRKDLREDSTLYPSDEALKAAHIKRPYSQRAQKKVLKAFLNLKSK